MTSGRRLVAAATFVVALVGTTVGGPGTAHACSCAVPDPVAVLSNAHVIVHGETIEAVDLSPSEGQIDRRFLFRVDARYPGDTPDVIEIRVETALGNCDDTVTSVWPVMFLGEPTAEGWYAYPPCGYEPLVSELDAFFDDVWPLSGRGPPAAIAAAATLDHDLVVLDSSGEPLQYLPGPGPTLVSPGAPVGTEFVQLRRTSWDGDAVEPVWQYAGWTELGTVVIDSIQFDAIQFGAAAGYPSIPLACLAPDGLTSFIGWGAGLDVVGSAVTPHESVFSVVAPGPAGYELISDAVGLSVAMDPDQPTVPVEVDDSLRYTIHSIEVTETGWRVSVIQNRFPGPTALVTTDITLDGTTDELSTAFIGVPLHGWAAMPVDTALASSLVITPGATPIPLFERSGTVVDAPAPTLAAETEPLSIAPAPSGPVTEPAPPSTLPASEPTSSLPVAANAGEQVDDGGSNVGWAIGGAVALLAVALVGFALTRRTTTRRKAS